MRLGAPRRCRETNVALAASRGVHVTHPCGRYRLQTHRIVPTMKTSTTPTRTGPIYLFATEAMTCPCGSASCVVLPMKTLEPSWFTYITLWPQIRTTGIAASLVQFARLCVACLAEGAGRRRAAMTTTTHMRAAP